MFGISYIISSSKIKSIKNVDNSIYENSNLLNENRQFNNTINNLSINEDLKSLNEINEEKMIEKLN